MNVPPSYSLLYFSALRPRFNVAECAFFTRLVSLKLEIASIIVSKIQVRIRSERQQCPLPLDHEREFDVRVVKCA